MRVAVIRFPGTNGDLDVAHVLNRVIGLRADVVWHGEFKDEGYDAAVVPGGFSYGDWLRAGAIAARSPALRVIREMADEGKPILGICNGFQILVESGLLPGALLPNDPPRFIAKWVRVKVLNVKTPFTTAYGEGEVVSMPIAHGEGRYYIDNPAEVNTAFSYHGENPNGSINNIAGVANKDGNVVGLMPHPERASEDILVPRGHSKGGLKLWLSLKESLTRGW
ncbi:phosphoribosylformylglycinamidine synthase I [Vulcanisaeta sp. EB80]|jgi:phosphoribosylformylglycinamidine synthase|uniref:phosphoribosylformylglycinamidine synthase subunit PurQ n=1 Tax=Vulcanisaeta sp. EB80 TaxID=1650660 RepID=UPI0009BD1D6A|nr:phosphoribosylformylglycinamidine synthase subunit PurQ [Vulcanisaeta sp. EB80]MDT7863475.1 phosphoribosylformylglycinamidine synthase subunit PurQ [Vulcanisaeta sp.]MDT7969098.1 phosphoribosylformylglycinamidine synthase subunit PurQ [Vulcanisaeta sp.]PLC68010.1 phosphoribosylformylglycinamidine synthase I [Vulcanisaeta sp. EB80]